MKPKRNVWATILCDAYGQPFKMIVADNESVIEIIVQHYTLKTVKKAAKDVYGVTDIFVSLIKDA